MKNLEAHITESLEAAHAALTELLDGEAATPAERILRRDLIRATRSTINNLQVMLSDARKLNN